MSPNGNRTRSFRPHANLSLKLISLGLAFGLWTLVPDSSVPHLVRGVPVQIINLPAELALAEPFEAEVDVWVHGSPIRTGNLLPGELSPDGDLVGAFAGENLITLTPADIPTPLGVTVDSVQPAQLRIALEEKIRTELPVNPVVEGNPATGFEIYERRVEPATVFVTGPRSRVEQLAGVSTEVVNVSGRRSALTRSVTILSDDPVVTVEDSAALLSISIDEIKVVYEIEGVQIDLINAEFRAVVNPSHIGVLLSGPPSLLETLTANNIFAEIDLTGLAPRSEDYSLQPRVRLEPVSLGARITVLATRPQRLMDVHIYETAAAGVGR